MLLHRFRNKLIEGRIFIIRDFDVFRSGNLYRLSDHQYIIRFTDSTFIEEVDEATNVIPPEKFHLHSRDELLQLVDKNEYLPDVIGFLCQFEKAKVYGENKPKRAVLHIYLEERIKIRLTIWDNMVDTIEEKLQEINERTIVIVATSLLPKMFSGTLCLNPSSATKIYLNADFEIIRDFCGRMKYQPEFDHSYKTVASKDSDTRLHSISEMLNFIYNEKEQEKEFTCKATVREVILRNGWNYISCSNCARKMEKTDTTLTCNYCKDSKSVGVLRFRIEVVVDDGRDTTTFVIFDKDAKKITNTTATALMEYKEGDADKDKHDQVPASVLNIVGKTFKFQIKITQYNFRAKYQSFTVSRILDDTLATEIEEPQQKTSSKKAREAVAQHLQNLKRRSLSGASSKGTGKNQACRIWKNQSSYPTTSLSKNTIYM